MRLLHAATHRGTPQAVREKAERLKIYIYICLILLIFVLSYYWFTKFDLENSYFDPLVFKASRLTQPHQEFWSYSGHLGQTKAVVNSSSRAAPRAAPQRERWILTDGGMPCQLPFWHEGHKYESLGLQDPFGLPQSASRSWVSFMSVGFGEFSGDSYDFKS